MQVCDLLEIKDQQIDLNRMNSNLMEIGLDLSHISGRRRRLTTPRDFHCERNENGLSVKFSLPKGSYATMCLREWSHGGIVG